MYVCVWLVQAVTGLRRGKRVVQACQLLCALLRDLPSLPELQRCVAAKSSASIVPELAAADPLVCWPLVVGCAHYFWSLGIYFFIVCVLFNHLYIYHSLVL